ncbi:YcaO-like family protein [Ruegeria sp. SCP11]|uniref:YcaO-like family protein n=1 Tax=Ruegeria sp. SCP11 TaxID=3141378 RepID=UPI003335E542
MLETGLFKKFRRDNPIASLVQPKTGLVMFPRRISHILREPDFNAISAPIGDLSMLKPNIQTKRHRSGIGSGGDPELALLRAVVEAAERYACLIYDETDFLVCSAASLKDKALNFQSFATCSDAELSHPKCPLKAFSEDEEIRWVRGFSLVDDRDVFVPAIMVHLSMVPRAGELFWLQISTGAAGHTNPASALVSGICECVERDAISMTWLGRLPLPRLTDTLVAEAMDGLDIGQLSYNFFDATTDLGVPTVMGVQGGDFDQPISMTCASALTMEDAVRKALREAGPLRTVLYQDRAYPDDPEDFSEVIDGAAYYADGNRLEAFDFLLSSVRPDMLHMPACASLSEAQTPEEQLVALTELLASKGHEAVAVDITTDELRDVGLWIIRAILPSLMPLSFSYRARYLGTPRLYHYMRMATGRTFAETRVNPDPIPFA